MFLDIAKDRKEARTANKGFASGGVMRKLGALCFYSSLVQVDPARAGLRNPLLRQARECYDPSLVIYFQFLKNLLCLKNEQALGEQMVMGQCRNPKHRQYNQEKGQILN
jgi:hypothetical protein